MRKSSRNIIILLLAVFIAGSIAVLQNGGAFNRINAALSLMPHQFAQIQVPAHSAALTALASVAIKGRAPQTNYTRAQFGDGWATQNGCDTRDIILKRDLTNVRINSSCEVVSGVLNDPYTAKPITFVRGVTSSSAVQIDHVVALSNAWQTGAQLLNAAQRQALANDPLELLAVDGPTNQSKGDGDAATWLPPNKSYRCSYVARQVAVKIKYSLWMTQAEYNVIQNILSGCPNQALPQ